MTDERSKASNSWKLVSVSVLKKKCKIDVVNLWTLKYVLILDINETILFFYFKRYSIFKQVTFEMHDVKMRKIKIVPFIQYRVKNG